ncbi:hypothetical protein D1895_25570 [Escherichia coli]|nr:hypothetical protein D1895_25570 [Escherichia coli]
MSYVHSKFIRLRGYYQFYPLVRIKSIWKHILSALRDKRCDIRDRGYKGGFKKAHPNAVASLTTGICNLNDLAA